MKKIMTVSVISVLTIFWTIAYDNGITFNKDETINDRKRLVEVETNLIIEIEQYRKTIKEDIEKYNSLNKRKKCIEDKNQSYSQGKTFEEVSKFVCNDDYKKAKVVFQ